MTRTIAQSVQIAGSTTIRRRQRYQHIVDRFEEIARARLGELNRISDICAAIDVSERTLERAFRAIYGITASRHLHGVRLAEARKALLSAGLGAENVTQVAVRFGFYELGRFAGESIEQRSAKAPPTPLAAAAAGQDAPPRRPTVSSVVRQAPVAPCFALTRSTSAAINKTASRRSPPSRAGGTRGHTGMSSNRPKWARSRHSRRAGW